jgi:hypothetical protein
MKTFRQQLLPQATINLLRAFNFLLEAVPDRSTVCN